MEYMQSQFIGARHSDETRNIHPHTHRYFELNFLTSGVTRMRINNQVVEYNSYDFILIPPDFSHILHESEYKKFDNYVIWFTTTDSSVNREAVTILHDYEGVVQFLCSEIYRLHITGEDQYTEIINIYLQAVLWHMRRGKNPTDEDTQQSSDDIIRDAVVYINKYILSKRFTVEEVALRHNVSMEHFCRIFRKKIGTSPIRYMNELKINEAKRLLTEASPIKEIASRLHYNDPYYFSKQFRQYTGMSPRQYREKKRQHENEKEPD